MLSDIEIAQKAKMDKEKTAAIATEIKKALEEAAKKADGADDNAASEESDKEDK